MAKIISSFFIALDGVVESPDQWHFPYWNDEMGAAVQAGMADSAGMLMGRVLYEEWAAYWPTAEADAEIAAIMNDSRKWVVSSTLDKAEWANTTLLRGDVAAEIRRLKAEVEGNIQMSGSATAVRWLLANGLLDQLNLLVHPIAVGHGRRLFEGSGTQPLKLVKSETFETGVLNLSYVPAAG
ncbi:dihydrofolate reductase family protein [Nonomuraea sp. NPDC050328]|uniref:dihydrofolate reductase family protein n=1 Tax=Nonomuraea sp. NPDC050328 TaxID=3364361 RepID=UPI0037B26398